jgi:ubiquitin C-terminal hydrolase
LNVNVWDLVRQQYNISKNRAHETNLFLHRNLLSILQDNWIGQCSSGHSCKHKTKEELGYMIQSLPGGSKVYESLQKMKKKKNTDS